MRNGQDGIISDLKPPLTLVLNTMLDIVSSRLDSDGQGALAGGRRVDHQTVVLPCQDVAWIHHLDQGGVVDVQGLKVAGRTDFAVGVFGKGFDFVAANGFGDETQSEMGVKIYILEQYL